MKRSVVRVYTGLVASEGVYALARLWAGPWPLPDTFNSFTPTYQFATILGVALLALITLLAAVIFVSSWIFPEDLQKGGSALLERFQRGRSFYRTAAVLLAVVFFAAQFLLQKEGLVKDIQIRFLDLMVPVLIWVILVSIQSVLALLAISDQWSVIKQPAAARTMIILVVLVLIWAGISWTGMGFTRSSQVLGLFRVTGYPLLGYQTVFAWGGCLALLVAANRVQKQSQKSSFLSPCLGDTLIAAALILSAILLWRGIPIEPNAFIDIPRPPNYTLAPSLDAMIYDRTAQNFLARGAFQSYLVQGDYFYQEVGRRPLLAAFYAGLHSLSGLGYEEVIQIQILLFTVFPVLIYLLAKTLHSRPAGIMAALLTIFRQRNGMMLGEEVTGSNLHMMMSDIPATIGVLLFLYLFLLWLEKKEKTFVLALLSGGVLGAAMMIRQEVAVILPFLVGLAAIQNRDQLGRVARDVLWMGGGVVLLIAPWMIRNWQLSGHLYFDQPGELNFIIRTIDLIKMDPDSSSGLPGNLQGKAGDFPKVIEGAGRAFGVLAAKGASAAGSGGGVERISVPTKDNAALSFLQTGGDLNGVAALQPGDSRESDFRLIGNHLANSFTQSFLYLPSNPLMANLDYLSRFINGQLNWSYGGILYSQEEYVSRLPYWKPTWDGSVAKVSFPTVGLMLAFIAVGISRTRRRGEGKVWVPVLTYASFLSIYALTRRSGGRFLLEVDWIPVLFFSIGALEITWLLVPGLKIVGKDFFRDGRIGRSPYPSFEKGRVFQIILPVGLLLCGAAIPLMEAISKNPYTPEAKQEQVADLLKQNAPPFSPEEVKSLETFMDQGGDVLYGRALYPRYFLPDREMINTIELYFESHTTFYLSGSDVEYAVLPQLQPPEYFPHGSDVIVFGCQELPIEPGEEQVCLHCFDRGFDPVVVVLYGEDGMSVEDVLWRAGEWNPFTGCPLDRPW